MMMDKAIIADMAKWANKSAEPWREAFAREVMEDCLEVIRTLDPQIYTASGMKFQAEIRIKKHFGVL